MAYRFQIDGYFLRVTDTDTDQILINEVRDSVKWSVAYDETYGDASYMILFKESILVDESQNDEMFLIFESMDFADIVDSTDSAFASESDFEEWISAYIGYINTSIATITDSDGVTTFTVVSGGTGACTVVAASGTLLARPPIPRSGTSYRLGDARSNIDTGFYDFTNPVFPEFVQELDYTKATPSLWLKYNNSFGNKARFTLNDGTPLTTLGDTTLRSYVVDNLTGFGWAYDGMASRTWSDAVDDALAFSVTVDSDTYDDFVLPSILDQQTLSTFETRYPFTSGMPFSLGLPASGFYIWSSDTWSYLTTYAWRSFDNAQTTVTSKSGILDAIFCRKHF